METGHDREEVPSKRHKRSKQTNSGRNRTAINTGTNQSTVNPSAAPTQIKKHHKGKLRARKKRKLARQSAKARHPEDQGPVSKYRRKRERKRRKKRQADLSSSRAGRSEPSGPLTDYSTESGSSRQSIRPEQLARDTSFADICTTNLLRKPRRSVIRQESLPTGSLDEQAGYPGLVIVSSVSAVPLIPTGEDSVGFLSQPAGANSSEDKTSPEFTYEEHLDDASQKPLQAGAEDHEEQTRFDHAEVIYLDDSKASKPEPEDIKGSGVQTSNYPSGIVNQGRASPFVLIPVGTISNLDDFVPVELDSSKDDSYPETSSSCKEDGVIGAYSGDSSAGDRLMTTKTSASSRKRKLTGISSKHFSRATGKRPQVNQAGSATKGESRNNISRTSSDPGLYSHDHAGQLHDELLQSGIVNEVVQTPAQEKKVVREIKSVPLSDPSTLQRRKLDISGEGENTKAGITGLNEASTSSTERQTPLRRSSRISGRQVRRHPDAGNETENQSPTEYSRSAQRKKPSRTKASLTSKSSSVTATPQQDHELNSKNTVEIKTPSKKRRVPAGTSATPVPPTSSKRFGIIQEKLWEEPFWLLIAVTFLNQTSGRAAAPTFWALKEQYPTPENLSTADQATLCDMIRHLGLQNIRSRRVIEMAKEWVRRPPVKGVRHRTLHYPSEGDGRDYARGVPIEEDIVDCVGALEIGHMPGCGRYAYDSWRIFCRDVLRGVAEDYNGHGSAAAGDAFEPEWKRVLPQDKELRGYLRWMWLREGWIWNEKTGKRTEATPDERRRGELGEMDVSDPKEALFAARAAAADATETESDLSVASEDGFRRRRL